jgi:hypothetical protein
MLNTCIDANCDTLSIAVLENISFTGNNVEDNVASRIVHLQARDPTVPNRVIEVYGNNFLRNRAATATSGANAPLALSSNESSLWKVNGNTFFNPASGLDITTYADTGARPEDMIVNAMGNVFAYHRESLTGAFPFYALFLSFPLTTHWHVQATAVVMASV